MKRAPMNATPRPLALLTAALALSVTVMAEEEMKLEYTLIFPDEKGTEVVKPEEPNPFIAVGKEAQHEETNSEENIVKERLLGLRIVGVSPRADGYRILLGDIWLEAGMTVPPFLPEQSVRLRVNDITEEGVEFVWQEKVNTGLPPRTLFMPMRIDPEVRYQLPGQRGSPDSAEPKQEPEFGIAGREKILADGNLREKRAKLPLRAEVVDEEPVIQRKERPSSEADSVLEMFFSQGGKLPRTQ
ncbi:MAG: hypothetical protein KDK99_03970 [Verrucomicrobiales bacterium]|nr:hypothetical protein [Verrucomicrobiales bacterium]